MALKRRLPLAILGADGIQPATGVSTSPPRIGTAGRIELLRLWDSMPQKSKRLVLQYAREITKADDTPG